jgi:PHD/YefM family antitoxin component YafN of YafNO toxin-antitoxin module
MDTLDTFGLDADISVSELRQEDVLDARLQQHHRLRVRRRNDVVGVLVEAEEWRTISAYVRELRQQLDRAVDELEDAAVRRILAERIPDGEFVQGTAAVWDEIDREYRTLVGE